MSTALALSIAITFIWLGMVLAISFIEAPLKFRAPNVTLAIGLGIGRLVFKALNTIEFLFAVVLAIALVAGRPSGTAEVLLAIAIISLLIQIIAVRPRLTKRSDAVLMGQEDLPRSHAHYVYIAFEGIKVVALLIGGILLLSA